MQIQDLIQFHRQTHEGNPVAADTTHCFVGNDGVKECNSTSVSLNVYAVRFKNCGLVYPVCIVRPTQGYHHDSDETLKAVIEDLK